ncbi:MAG: dehydrogenase, short-chain alcohol dehydrogenase like [Verrucomicrobiaceae bacterium]|nr:dehydrogenase, short-chain alcohol dehydrogenase like [Verrucomicrobiaceae bacterium]
MSKVLVITGASRGIGFATAQLFAEKDFTIFNLSRSPSSAANIHNVEVDFGGNDWQSTVTSTLLPAIAKAEQVVLVHNAAANIRDSLLEFSVDDFRRVLEINLVAPAQLSHLLLPQMRAGSSIIYVGSTLGEIAVPNSCAYVTSKHALIGLMRSTCQDLAGTGVHTACVCPGFTDTEMLRQHVGNSEEVLQSLAAGVTQKRLIQPSEIARTVYFCADNAVISGAVIHANLGQIQS